ncbi:MAG TPA: asparagine--tRNA ligase [Bacilli bacterium]|nr:asparagine--tRNA ligase [Bacilli bacterium]
MMYERLKNATLKDNVKVNLRGWVRSNRNNGTIGFIDFNDGTAFLNVQLVYEKDKVANFSEIDKYRTGYAINVSGKVVLTEKSKQPFEVHIEEVEVINEADSDYPLQKKRHTFDYLREIAHLRPRTNTFLALHRVRSELTFAFHEFFHKNDFIYVHTPILTGNDAEGAGQVFTVVTDNKNPHQFFGKETSLTVSGQLHVEAFAQAFQKVYTFGPTFRAEASNTSRHAAEFWMLEPEMAFTDLNGNMDVIEASLKYAISHILKTCPDEMAFFNTHIEKGIIARLEKLVNSDFKKITYDEAIKVLEKAQACGVKFSNNEIHWGMDLGSEHERYLCEKHVNGPLFVTNYPKDIKAFYMRLNDDGKTVAACDLLVPNIGELVGGSQREDRYDYLLRRMTDEGNIEDLEWYLDLRKYGGVQTSGFGIGFDRLLMYVTGITNIRDVQPFGRAYGTIKY